MKSGRGGENNESGLNSPPAVSANFEDRNTSQKARHMYLRRYAREHAESVDTMRGILVGVGLMGLLFWLPLIVLLTWWVG